MILILKSKEADKPNISNFRPISITPTLYRMFSGLLADRIMNIAHLALSPAQRGFLRPDGHHLNSLELLEIVNASSRSMKNAACILFLDFEKALDRIKHRPLVKRCDKIFGSYFDYLVADLFSDSINSIDIDNESSLDITD
ncbi:Retrovirus-related Pol polyprotein from type-1 retrotransposable element R2 [Thelohanellus kitauei]|uniref:Retrovirus-related Pol polyprotein from type-1 retrotransposable element R2 n=1 Tax=Thelohanellus kitauei TaxID=669202 RepID=A0A0C2MCG8_THEKT|nr:Retrovirus-related Pol polyprotein from type-1 retrotransposable element R2 [Thelohanellus kitauei]